VHEVGSCTKWDRARSGIVHEVVGYGTEVCLKSSRGQDFVMTRIEIFVQPVNYSHPDYREAQRVGRHLTLRAWPPDYGLVALEIPDNVRYAY
jgi:hypothetical protein